LSAISTFGSAEGVDVAMTNYDPQYSHALAADESEEVRTEMFSATVNYDFGIFDANLVFSDRKVTEDAVTDWARIDMDDYVPAPLIVEGDRTNRKTTELRLTSKPGQFEWTVGYYEYDWAEEPNSVSQTQYAMDQDWLNYVSFMLVALLVMALIMMLQHIVHLFVKVMKAILTCIMVHILGLIRKKKHLFWTI